MSARDVQNLLTRRTAILAGVGGAVWTGLIARLFQLQVLESGKYTDAARENGIKRQLDPPSRGRILDRFGRPLASHRQAGRVSLVREKIGGPDAMQQLLAKIAGLIDLPAERQVRIVRAAMTRERFLSTIIAEELSYEDFARMSLHAAELPGIEVEMAATRSYPRGRDFAHVLGYVARANDKEIMRFILEQVEPTLSPSDKSNIDFDKLRADLDWTKTRRAVKDDAELSERFSQARRQVRSLYLHPNVRTGRLGIELTSDKYLRGEPGTRMLVTNAAGREDKEVAERVIDELPSDDPPTSGQNLSLTIDAELQRFAVERFGGESGSAVVLDIETGDILAFVSTPAFDSNDFVNGISQKDYDVLRGNDRSPLYHKAYDGTYPPGSTFKMVVAAAALESGAVKPHETVYCPGHYRFANRTWHCWKPEGHGTRNMHSGIKGSCDVYFYEIARRTGYQPIADMARKFGFGQKWELGMTGGRAGVVPDDDWKRDVHGERWYEGETLNFGIGQGYLTATPLQLAVMAARIASEGRIIEPRIIGAGPDLTKAGIRHDEMLDPDIMRRMKAGMFGVTSEPGGTARSSGDLGLGGPRLAGKTGTAQVRRITAAERASGVLKGEQLARKLRDHALFVAYAPADDPKYAISVIVEHAGGGSRNAAPVARDILAEAIRRDSKATPAYSQTASRSSGKSSKGAP